MQNLELITNSFPFLFLELLKGHYRFIDFEGFHEDDPEHEIWVGRLAKRLSYTLEPRVPVARIRHQGKQRIVIGAEARVPSLVSIGPFDISLHPSDQERLVQFASPGGFEGEIARRFLRFAVKGLLFRDNTLWENGSRCISRAPLFSKGITGDIDRFSAFSFGIIAGENGLPELSLDTSVCYVDRYSLTERHPNGNFEKEKGSRFLYRFGDDWYPINLLSTRNPVGDCRFNHPQTGKRVTLLEYTQNKWHNSCIADQIKALKPTDLAISYKDDKDETKTAVAPLLYKIPDTEDPRVKSLHSRSILPPSMREKLILKTLRKSFKELQIFGQKIKTRQVFNSIPYKKFPHPVHVFGNDFEIDVPLQNLGRARWDALSNPETGPYTSPFSPAIFDPQNAFVPESMPDGIKEDFLLRFGDVLGTIYPARYAPKQIAFNDLKNDTLPSQLNEIEWKFNLHGIHTGYNLFILPKNAHPLLHNTLKREGWPHYQYQCAKAQTIESFYKKQGNQYIVANERDYRSYLRLLAIGLLLVNRKWLWRFKEGTFAHDLIIGIDVRENAAAFTFIYDDAEIISFEAAFSSNNEKLSAEQVCKVIYETIKEDFEDRKIPLRNILILRDGHLFDTEIKGIDTAIQKLKNFKYAEGTCSVGLYEIHKTSSYHPRLFTKLRNGTIDNPEMGAYRLLNNAQEAILATTGYPMLDSKRTADPLHIAMIRQGLPFEDALKDIYSSSHLSFSSPSACHRKPFGISLGDEILRTASPDVDEDAAQYESLQHQRAVA